METNVKLTFYVPLNNKNNGKVLPELKDAKNNF